METEVQGEGSFDGRGDVVTLEPVSIHMMPSTHDCIGGLVGVWLVLVPEGQEHGGSGISR